MKEDKNFLNNQNYILGKAEKKKLLSKFFVELFFSKINNFIWLIPRVIKYDIFYIVFSILTLVVVFSITMFFDIHGANRSITPSGLWFTLKVFFFIFIPSLIITLIWSIFLNTNKEYLSLDILKESKTYFTKWWDLFSITFFTAIFIWFVIYFFAIWLWYVNFIIIIILFKFYKKSYKFLKKIYNLKLLQVLFLPFVLIFIIVIIPFIYINILFKNRINKYFFIRKRIKFKFRQKFKKLSSGYAENKFYKITLK